MQWTHKITNTIVTHNHIYNGHIKLQTHLGHIIHTCNGRLKWQAQLWHTLHACSGCIKLQAQQWYIIHSCNGHIKLQIQQWRIMHTCKGCIKLQTTLTHTIYVQWADDIKITQTQHGHNTYMKETHLNKSDTIWTQRFIPVSDVWVCLLKELYMCSFHSRDYTGKPIPLHESWVPL